MNVALFASAFYPQIGGVEEVVRQTAHAYRRRGVGVTIIANRWPRSLPNYVEYEGLDVHRLALRVPDGCWKAHLSCRLTHHAIRAEMLSLLKKKKIDLLHVHCVSHNAHYGLLAKRALKLPLVVTAHGELSMDATNLYDSEFMHQVLRDSLTEADHVTACSQHTLDEIERYYGQPLGERASVVYGGIKVEDFVNAKPYSHPRPYVLAIGRLVPQKGFDVLLRAFAQANLPGHDLLLAGEGTERDALQQLTRDLSLTERVTFIGPADRPLAVSLFKGCSFFVMSSRTEPMGLVNLEAMMAGKAVIAPCVGGVPEIVLDEETGLLVRPEDEGAFAAALRRLAEDALLRERLGAAGHARAQEFTWTASAQQYLQIYERIR